MKNLLIALAALAALVVLPAGAQSLGYTPTAAEAQQARANAQRDARMADAMEKERLAAEARGPSLHIAPGPVEAPIADTRGQPGLMAKPFKAHHFVAVAPGEKKTKKKKHS